jgi:hypothetical protein
LATEVVFVKKLGKNEVVCKIFKSEIPEKIISYNIVNWA